MLLTRLVQSPHGAEHERRVITKGNTCGLVRAAKFRHGPNTQERQSDGARTAALTNPDDARESSAVRYNLDCSNGQSRNCITKPLKGLFIDILVILVIIFLS
jgi:hypothetical protein